MEEDERTDDADRGPSENKRVAPTPLSRLRRTPAQGAVPAGSSAGKYVCLVPRSPNCGAPASQLFSVSRSAQAG